MRHICMPANHTINGIYMQCNILLNENNQSHEAFLQRRIMSSDLKFSLIVGNKFNPIACTNHVHHHTKLVILIAHFVKSKQQSDSFPLHII